MMRMSEQVDWVGPAAADLTAGPFLGKHKRRMGALLKHFHRGGLTLEVCADHKHLARKVSTLKPYCRRLKLAFPDYVPLALRPPKPPKKSRARKAQTSQPDTK